MLAVLALLACSRTPAEPGPDASAARDVSAPTVTASAALAYRNRGSGEPCLDVAGNRAVAGTPLILWSCHMGQNQRFAATSAGELRAMDGRLCVDVRGGRGYAGDRLIVGDCRGGAHQRWTRGGDGQLRGTSGLCAAPVGRRTARGTPLELVPCTAAAEQRWLVGAPVASLPPALGPLPTAHTARMADSVVETIGVNTHLGWFDRGYYRDFASIVLPKLTALGVRHLRDAAPVYPDDGWMGATYANYRRVHAATGARFTLIVDARGTAAGRGRDYADASHVRTVLRHVGDAAVEAFEGLNEHDQSGRVTWAAEVASMQRALWTTVRSDPTLARYAVLGPTVTTPQAVAALGDLSAYMDMGAMHPYAGGGTPTSAVAFNLARYRPLHGARPVQATETGYTTAVQAPAVGHQPVSAAAAGRYVPRLVLEHFDAGIRRSFLYELLDQGTDPRDVEQGFGLVRADGSEKPAFVALRSLIALLADPGPAFTTAPLTYALAGDTAGVHRLVLQRRDGRHLLVLWHAASSWDEAVRRDLDVPPRTLTLVLARAPRTLRTHLPLHGGAGTRTVAATERLPISVPDHPLVVEITP